MILALAVMVPTLLWDKGPETAPILERAEIKEIAVPPALAARWKGQSSLSCATVDPATLTVLQVPRVDYRINEARATSVPWLENNGGQFLRYPDRSYLYKAPGKSAAIAAAEASMFGVRAYIDTDEEGLRQVAPILRFLRTAEPEPGPPVTNIGVVDDGSSRVGELLKLLVRYNLLVRPEPSPDKRLRLNVQIGSAKYPTEEAADPHHMALLIRGDLGDENRDLRTYGSDVVLGRLTGDEKKLRVHLLNYSARPVHGLRVKIAGAYAQQQARAPGAAAPQLLDVSVGENATEFTIPLMENYLIVDLTR